MLVFEAITRQLVRHGAPPIKHGYLRIGRRRRFGAAGGDICAWIYAYIWHDVACKAQTALSHQSMRYCTAQQASMNERDTTIVRPTF